jgi:hypothetical protein
MSKTMGAKASDVLQDKTGAVQTGDDGNFAPQLLLERVDASTSTKYKAPSTKHHKAPTRHQFVIITPWTTVSDS